MRRWLERVNMERECERASRYTQVKASKGENDRKIKETTKQSETL